MDDDGPVVLGNDGWHRLDDGHVEGVDPLLPFGPYAPEFVKRVAHRPEAPDIYVNSLLDPGTDEVAAFEGLVGCHGGLGGWQDRACAVVPGRPALPRGAGGRRRRHARRPARHPPPPRTPAGHHRARRGELTRPADGIDVSRSRRRRARRPPRAGVPRSRARSGRRTPRRTSRGRGRSCPRAEVAGDGDRVPRACVRACQRPATHPGVSRHRRGVHRLHDRRTLAVPQLPDEEVPVNAVDPVGPHPAEHHVARGLHQALALDDALTVAGISALAEEGFQHRCLGLLGLEEQRVLVVVADQEHDPGTGADTSDADHLAGGVAEAEPLEEVPMIPRQGSPVAVQDVQEGVLDLVASLSGISSWIRTIIGGSLIQARAPIHDLRPAWHRPSCCPSARALATFLAERLSPCP